MYRKIVIIVVTFMALAGASAGAVYFYNQNKIKKIDSFQSCAQAGYPVAESYPEQCRTPDGRVFINKTINDYIRDKYLPPGTACQNLCGDGDCQEIVCLAIGCPCAETPQTCPDDCQGLNSISPKPSAAPKPDGEPEIANPASVYCKNLGGIVEIRTDAQENQTGYCKFPNGQECEEWVLFRNECALSPSSQMAVLEGQATISSACPDKPSDLSCSASAETYAGRQVIIYKPDKRTEIARQNFSAAGIYHFELPPGVYVVDVSRVSLDKSEDLPQAVILESGKTLQLNFDINAGVQ